MNIEIVHAMVPRDTFNDPESGLKWLYFEYDGTFEGYKRMPLTVKMGEVLFYKMSHNSDTKNVAYRQTEKDKLAFYTP